MQVRMLASQTHSGNSKVAVGVCTKYLYQGLARGLPFFVNKLTIHAFNEQKSLTVFLLSCSRDHRSIFSAYRRLRSGRPKIRLVQKAVDRRSHRSISSPWSDIPPTHRDKIEVAIVSQRKHLQSVTVQHMNAWTHS